MLAEAQINTEDIMTRLPRISQFGLTAFGIALCTAQGALAQENETFGAWTRVCNAEGAQQSCLISQVLKDDEGNNVAEVSIVDVADGDETVAGISIATPLDTLLLPGVRFQVDAFDENRLPFNFCQPGGCVVQIGLTQENIDIFSTATAAAVTIVPVAAPDVEVALSLSFDGFADAFASLQSE